MAGTLSDYAENAVLDGICGGTAFSKPATVYLALWTAALSDTSTGATAGEVSTSGTAYARVAVTNNATNWPNASGGSKSLAVAFSFPAATGSGFGTVTHAAILDGGTVGAGNILFWFDLTASKTVAAGDTATFAIGSITLTLA